MGAVALPAVEGSPWHVLPHGLLIVGGNAATEATGVVAFSQRPGTGLALHVGGAPGPIRAFDAAASRVQSLQDQGGRDLVAGAAPQWSLDGIAPDGQEASISVQLPRWPAVGTQSLHLRAEAVFTVGGEERVERLPAQRLVAGSRLHFSACTWTVVSVGPSRWRAGGHEVVLSASGDTAAVRAWRCVDANGQELQVQRLQHPAKQQTALLFPAEPGPVSLELTLLAGAQRVTVPINATFTLGLADRAR
jgi:hypothetical protein